MVIKIKFKETINIKDFDKKILSDYSGETYKVRRLQNNIDGQILWLYYYEEVHIATWSDGVGIIFDIDVKEHSSQINRIREIIKNKMEE